MTAELEGGEWSAARPGSTLPPGKTRYPFYRRLGGPQGRSGRAETLVPTGIWSRSIQPVVSRYTDWATRPTLTWSGKYILDFSWVTSSCLLQCPLLPQVTYNVMITAMCYLLSNCFCSGYMCCRKSMLFSLITYLAANTQWHISVMSSCCAWAVGV